MNSNTYIKNISNQSINNQINFNKTYSNNFVIKIKLKILLLIICKQIKIKT